MKVLVVEDDRSIQMVLELVFTHSAKCELLLAAEGREALELAQAEKPALVVIDLMLPGGMDGLELCHRLKADPVTRSIPVIFLTAQPQPAAKDKALALGAVGYFVKPFDPLTLLKQINDALIAAKLAPLTGK